MQNLDFLKIKDILLFELEKKSVKMRINFFFKATHIINHTLIDNQYQKRKMYCIIKKKLKKKKKVQLK